MTTTEDKLVITKKNHECRVCGEVILAGEKAHSRSGFGSDGVWRIHIHPECEWLTLDWDAMDWESISPGEYPRPKNT